MSEPPATLLLVAMAVALPALAVFLVGRRRGRWIMLLAVIMAVAVYGQARNRFQRRLHHNFHYYLGAKYFDELGYDQLYNCAAAALPNRWGSFYRDLTTYGYHYGKANVPTCRAPFSAERWQAFVADVEWLRSQPASRPQMWSILMLDKGYNGSPSLTAASSWLANRAPLGSPQFWILIYLDTLLLAGGLLVLWRFFGVEAAGLCLLFAVTWQGNFTHLVGNWLQYAWLPALWAAAGLYDRRRALAGGLLATASALYLFPAIFLLWPALHWRQAGRRLWAGLAAGGAFWAIVGSLTGRGLGAWADFARNLQLHAAWLPIEPRNVGLRNLVNLVANPEASYFHHHFFSTGKGYPPNPLSYSSDWWLLPFVGALLVLIVLVCRQRRVFSLAAGLPALFVALVISPYYYIAAGLIFLDQDVTASRRLLMASVLLSAVAVFEPLAAWILFQLALLGLLLRHYAWPRAQLQPAPALVSARG